MYLAAAAAFVIARGVAGGWGFLASETWESVVAGGRREQQCSRCVVYEEEGQEEEEVAGGQSYRSVSCFPLRSCHEIFGRSWRALAHVRRWPDPD